MNLRQSQKDIEKDVLNYVDMKILVQVNCSKNLSEKEVKEAKNKNPNSDCLLYVPHLWGWKIAWY